MEPNTNQQLEKREEQLRELHLERKI